MPFKKFLIVLVFCFLSISCDKIKNDPAEITLIPRPNVLTQVEGRFVVDKNTALMSDPELMPAANFLTDYIFFGSGVRLDFKSKGQSISFLKDDQIDPEEGYRLDVKPDGIIIAAKNAKGAFYAVQTLRQLMTEKLENANLKAAAIAVPCVSISDSPRFKYRGMHLDVGRHFFPVEFIKKYIDALALLKFNTFHWHLTEDQGWRVEIKSYPKLNEVASFRNETLIGHYNDQPQRFDDTVYGGYYTQDEIREIVAYAQKRFITIIPEIEMPGHSQSVIAAYPELGCTGESVDVATKWGVFETIYCSKEETFEFLETVLDEVMGLFPSTYIHIGGDEAPKTNWEKCAACQKRIRDENLKDEHELQAYFISRIEKYLNQNNRQIIGWDEILEGGLAPNATVMSWRGIGGAVKAAKMNHDVILSPTSHCYFDYYQSESQDEPLAIGGFLPLRKVYDFEPIPEELNEAETQFVLGAQGNVWTEYMREAKQVEYMVFPRILAMSEVVWSAKDLKNYSDFVSRVERFHNRLKALDINYANHLFEINGQIKFTDGMGFYSLETESKSKTIRYTTDGQAPNSGSILYSEPIKIDGDIIVQAAVFDKGNQIGSVFTQEIKRHIGFGKEPTINVEPHKAYNAGGIRALTNGIIGSDTRYGDSEWLGFWGENLNIRIEFDKPTAIQSVSTRLFNAMGQWVYAPKMITIRTDRNEKTVSIDSEGLTIVPVNIPISGEVRFIELLIPGYGIISKGYQGEGNPAWTFIDEIIIQ
ncbi:MAG: family 20 glycosylhydrolase [Bacteroidia bacterium]|nr:family 20 glycosylhydrolase [Bacteroidia bacterium]